MPSHLESESSKSLADFQPNAGSTHFIASQKPLRAHPRLTGYRILSFTSTVGFGAVKAVLSYQGQTTSPTTVDWIYGIVVASALFWLGLYEEECPEKLPRWMFETDFVEGVGEIANKVRDLNLRILLRKVFGFPAQKFEDPEQRIELRNIPPMQPEVASESNATGIQIPHQSGSVRSRFWSNPQHQADALVECDYCERTFVSDNALHNHCVNKADHPYCESCEILFADERALQQHTRDAAAHQVRERQQDARPYCQTCERNFKDEHALQQTSHSRDAGAHQVCGRQKDARPYCQTCDRNFKDEQALQQHVEDSPAHRFCEPCKRQFPHREAMCQHLATSSSHDWCFACWKDFDDRASLKKHCTSVHTRNKTRTQCPLCEEKFDNPIAIALHIKRGCA